MDMDSHHHDVADDFRWNLAFVAGLILLAGCGQRKQIPSEFERGAADVDAALAGNPDPLTGRVAEALVANLAAWELEYLSQLDWSELNAISFLEDPALRRGFSLATPSLGRKVAFGHRRANFTRETSEISQATTAAINCERAKAAVDRAIRTFVVKLRDHARRSAAGNAAICGLAVATSGGLGTPVCVAAGLRLVVLALNDALKVGAELGVSVEEIFTCPCTLTKCAEAAAFADSRAQCAALKSCADGGAKTDAGTDVAERLGEDSAGPDDTAERAFDSTGDIEGGTCFGEIKEPAPLGQSCCQMGCICGRWKGSRACLTVQATCCYGNWNGAQYYWWCAPNQRCATDAELSASPNGMCIAADGFPHLGIFGWGQIRPTDCL